MMFQWRQDGQRGWNSTQQNALLHVRDKSSSNDIAQTHHPWQKLKDVWVIP